MSQTYEEILQGMLDRVPSNVDKREGSIIYDALAPCAFFLAQQQFLLDNYVDLVFSNTAVGEYLDRAVADHGVTRKAATAAVRQVSTDMAVNIGSVWGINDLTYKITELISVNIYKAECTTAGAIGNWYSGTLNPVLDVTSATAALGEVITVGAEEETDEALRERFYNKIRMPATSGNAYQYKQWALEVPGVGDAKVFPLDRGPGTITVLVVDNNKRIDSGLPDIVAEHIEEVRPIGATVSVENPMAKQIDISASVILDGSKTLEEVEDAFKEALRSFLSGMVFNTSNISYAKMGGLLLDIPGVEDYDELMVNSQIGNILIENKEIPMEGVITLTEAD